MSVAPPLFESTVAVMYAVPELTDVTSPLLDTVATAGAELLQVNTLPARVFPPSSRAVAVACVVWPTVRLVDARLTPTVDT